MHGFTLLAGLAAGIAGKVIMGISRHGDVGQGSSHGRWVRSQYVPSWQGHRRWRIRQCFPVRVGAG